MSKPVLAAAGIISILIVIAALVYFIMRLIKLDRGRKNDAPLAEDPLASLRAHYDALFAALEVPHNAMTVSLVCNACSEGSAMDHYCWLKDGALMLFPLWEGFAGESGVPVSPDIRPREWRVPVADIVCFATEQGLPNRFVILQFKKRGEVLTLAFSGDADRVFALLFPEKDFSHLLEELYPKSSRHIRDIKDNLVSLKVMREEDLITEEEYAAKKKELLILM